MKTVVSMTMNIYKHALEDEDEAASVFPKSPNHLFKFCSVFVHRSEYV